MRPRDSRKYATPSSPPGDPGPLESGREDGPAVLLSIRPVWLEHILAGRKTVELRKWFPRVHDVPLYLYATRPRQAVVACAVVDEVVEAPPETLWQRFADDCAVPRDEFDAYYGDRSRGVGVRISQVTELEALTLRTIQARIRGFRPPMSHQLLAVDHELRPWLAALQRPLD